MHTSASRARVELCPAAPIASAGLALGLLPQPPCAALCLLFSHRVVSLPLLVSRCVCVWLQDHIAGRLQGRLHSYRQLLAEAEAAGNTRRAAAARIELSRQEAGSARVLADIARTHATYVAEGMYARTSHMIIHDIVAQAYRPNVACMWRALCGWFNEVNYLSYRGQLTLFYAAARDNTTWMWGVNRNGGLTPGEHTPAC